MALEPTSTRNGTIWVQRGSHRRRLLVRADFESGGDFAEGGRIVEYNEAVRQLCEANAAAGLEEEPVVAGKGDVLFFSGAAHAADPASAAPRCSALCSLLSALCSLRSALCSLSVCLESFSSCPLLASNYS